MAASESLNISHDGAEAHTTIVVHPMNGGPTESERASSNSNAAEILAVLGNRIKTAGPDESEMLGDGVALIAKALASGSFVNFRTTLDINYA